MLGRAVFEVTTASCIKFGAGPCRPPAGPDFWPYQANRFALVLNLVYNIIDKPNLIDLLPTLLPRRILQPM